MRRALFAAACLALLAAAPAGAADTAAVFGAGISVGTAYDPETIPFILATGFVLLDYDRVVWHRAPDPLRLKLEGSVGTSLGESDGIIASVGALASFILDIGSATVFPYGEAGIGFIYTDFRVAGQGSKFNFNPQAGLGLEFRESGRPRGWLALRVHHLSNSDLDDENRGINSVLLQAGTMF
jgi:hypothetical protein